VEWLKPLLGHTVGLDTAPLIYFIERNPLYLPLVRPFFEAVECGDIEIVTSTITLTEVLIHPLRQGDTALARRYYRILLNASHV
jgi:predicted nucleic acid-binding protein